MITANIFLLSWIISSLCIFHIMIPIRKMLDRKRIMPISKEFYNTILFGPLLIIPLTIAGIKYYKERKELILEERKRLLNIVKNRFEILDL